MASAVRLVWWRNLLNLPPWRCLFSETSPFDGVYTVSRFSNTCILSFVAHMKRWTSYQFSHDRSACKQTNWIYKIEQKQASSVTEFIFCLCDVFELVVLLLLYPYNIFMRVLLSSRYLCNSVVSVRWTFWSGVVFFSRPVGCKSRLGAAPGLTYQGSGVWQMRTLVTCL